MSDPAHTTVDPAEIERFHSEAEIAAETVPLFPEKQETGVALAEEDVIVHGFKIREQEVLTFLCISPFPVREILTVEEELPT
jgi:hypothetical protein